MLKTVDDFQALARGQFDAAAQAATAFSAGLQAIASEAADYSKRSLDAGNVALQNLLGSRSVEAAVRVQTDYARSAFESFASEASKVGGLWSATAQNCFKPLELALDALRGSASIGFQVPAASATA